MNNISFNIRSLKKNLLEQYSLISMNLWILILINIYELMAIEKNKIYDLEFNFDMPPDYVPVMEQKNS